MGDDVKNGSGRREKSGEIGVGDGRSHKKRRRGEWEIHPCVHPPHILYLEIYRGYVRSHTDRIFLPQCISAKPQIPRYDVWVTLVKMFSVNSLNCNLKHFIISLS